MFSLNPFPNYFKENPISENDKNKLIEFCKLETFRKVEGGAYIIFYDECQDKDIRSILNKISKQAKDVLKNHFMVFLNQKLDEIKIKKKLCDNFKYSIKQYGPFINIIPKNKFINGHRDGYNHFVIGIFYLGTTDGLETQTTSLLDGEQILKLFGHEDDLNRDYSNINRINYGNSKNSALFFFNSESAYHMVDNIIENDRIILMLSFEIIVEK